MKKALKLQLLFILLFFAVNAFAQAPRELPFTMSVDDSESFIDIDGDGLADVYAWVNCYGCDEERNCAIQLQEVYGDAYIVRDMHAIDEAKDEKTGGMASYYAEYFEEGDEIGDAYQSYLSSFVKITRWYSILADARPDNFQSNTDGYIGVRFRANKAVGDIKQQPELNYGWIQVSIDNINNEVSFIRTGFLPEAGDPIAAGDLPVTPIPVIASLLGFGVIGIAAMRKRIKR